MKKRENIHFNLFFISITHWTFSEKSRKPKTFFFLLFFLSTTCINGYLSLRHLVTASVGLQELEELGPLPAGQVMFTDRTHNLSHRLTHGLPAGKMGQVLK